ncbi:MAG: TIGR04282 family arsenosugar biosynthesis glycosyltransferase [Arenicellales bacterium]
MIDPRSIPLYLFAKAPVPGNVKTRLQPQLGSEGCAALAVQMLHQSVKKIANYWPGKFLLCVTPNQENSHFMSISDHYRCEVIRQTGSNLGDRMLGALGHGIAESGTAVVMGCDIPQITGRVLTDAWETMQQGENIVGPTIDGGFYLLGLHVLRQEIFEGIEWGGDTVLDQLFRQAKQVGVSFRRLAMLRDIDRWEDLKWLAAHDSRYSKYVDANSGASNLEPDPVSLND